MPASMTVPVVRARKVRDGARPLVMVTAYDAPGARLVADGGADLLLVGDSVAMVVLGHDDTLQVTVDDLAHHTAAVSRGLRSWQPENVDAPNARVLAPLVVADLPWLSYHVSTEDAVRNAAVLIRAGAQAVKLEGGAKRVRVIEAIVDAEIPVMGHLGLTPQSLHAMGGFRVQAKQTEAALQLVAEAKALEAAGCFAIVLEGIPDQVATMVTAAVDVPTIGIGAGRRLRRPGPRLPRRARPRGPPRPQVRAAVRRPARRRGGRPPRLRRGRARRHLPERLGDLPRDRDGGRGARPLRRLAPSRMGGDSRWDHIDDHRRS